jgi:hypothetical protein
MAILRRQSWRLPAGCPILGHRLPRSSPLGRTTVSLPCPACAAKVRAPKWAGGRRFHCYRCGGRVTVPDTTTTAAETDRGPQTVVPAAVAASNSPAAAVSSVPARNVGPTEGGPWLFQPAAIVILLLAFGLALWASGLTAALAMTLSAAATVLLADAARSLRKVAAAASGRRSSQQSGS